MPGRAVGNWFETAVRDSGGLWRVELRALELHWLHDRINGIVRAMEGFLSIAGPYLRAEISPFGAALARVWLRNYPTSLVLGLPRPEDYSDAPQAIGVIVGPIAGRVANARVRINGREYRMEANTPPDCLHSGSGGVQYRLWHVAERSADRMTLSCHLPDGACGLPGNRNMTVTYAIEGRSLSISITTRTDADTVVNATSHAYWALDDSGGLSGHRLTVHASRMLETGPDLIPTGRVLDTAGSPFDFSTGRDPVSGPPLDACFCVDRPGNGSLRPVLDLHSLLSGLRLRVESNQPGVVLYTGQSMPHLVSPPATPTIGPYSSLAIEPQGWTDAANRADFPSIFLKKSGTIKQLSRFSFEIP